MPNLKWVCGVVESGVAVDMTTQKDAITADPNLTWKYEQKDTTDGQWIIVYEEA